MSKTYKLYIGGKFVRSESGRAMERLDKQGRFIANSCHASRKDLRDAVKAARNAFDDWRGRTPYNRAQVLYRAAEMLEARYSEFESLLSREAGLGRDAARTEVQAAVDRLVYYCGWADKFGALFGSVNPVSAAYFDFSVPEPMGVVGVVADEGTALIGLVSQVAPVIVSGNACVAVASDKYPLTALEFGEVLATSDLPGGVVNLLTGQKAELVPHMARHMDVNAMDYRDEALDREVIELGTENLKRLRLSQKRPRAWWLSEKAQGPEQIEAFVEIKTVWHPIGV
ncbi:MAG: aldehyde dehydrogenase family protein [Fimbriimonadaceae bacterium]